MQLSGFTQPTNGQGKFNSGLLDRSIILLHSLHIPNLLYLCMSNLLNFYPSSTTLAFQKCRTFCYKRDRSSLSPTSLLAPSNNWLEFNNQLRNEFGEYGCMKEHLRKGSEEERGVGIWLRHESVKAGRKTIPGPSVYHPLKTLHHEEKAPKCHLANRRGLNNS